jgi:hypothetical protein
MVETVEHSSARIAVAGLDLFRRLTDDNLQEVAWDALIGATPSTIGVSTRADIRRCTKGYLQVELRGIPRRVCPRYNKPLVAILGDRIYQAEQTSVCASISPGRALTSSGRFLHATDDDVSLPDARSPFPTVDRPFASGCRRFAFYVPSRAATLGKPAPCCRARAPNTRRWPRCCAINRSCAHWCLLHEECACSHEVGYGAIRYYVRTPSEIRAQRILLYSHWRSLYDHVCALRQSGTTRC